MTDTEKDRKSPAWIFAGLALAALAAAALMFRMGMGALEMSGPARELNLLLSEKTKACAGGRVEECERLKKSVQRLEEKMGEGKRAGGAVKP